VTNAFEKFNAAMAAAPPPSAIEPAPARTSAADRRSRSSRSAAARATHSRWRADPQRQTNQKLGAAGIRIGRLDFPKPRGRRRPAGRRMQIPFLRRRLVSLPDMRWRQHYFHCRRGGLKMSLDISAEHPLALYGRAAFARNISAARFYYQECVVFYAALNRLTRDNPAAYADLAERISSSNFPTISDLELERAEISYLYSM
jgi:hypothetical protein